MAMHTQEESNERAFAQELAVLREWDYIQQSFFHCDRMNLASQPSEHSRRTIIAGYITQITRGCARIEWEPSQLETIPPGYRLTEIRYKQIRYGMLELAPGYLVSNLLLGIPQHFAHLCALLLALTEHEELLQRQLKELSTTYDIEAMKALTPREKDVLQGLVKAESESEMAHRLNVTPTTIHSHLQRLYRRLDVHSAQQAVLRSFALRLLDWLDLPR